MAAGVACAILSLVVAAAVTYFTGFDADSEVFDEEQPFPKRPLPSGRSVPTGGAPCRMCERMDVRSRGTGERAVAAD